VGTEIETPLDEDGQLLTVIGGLRGYSHEFSLCARKDCKRRLIKM